MAEDIAQKLTERAKAFDAFLSKSSFFSGELLSQTDNRLREAMAYSLFAPAKRLRPILCLETCRAFGKPESRALLAAGALELIHTYSLIHDDLPCMDNDDLRRGRATNHKVYGDAMAVLAGDGLLTYAFEWLAESRELSPTAVVASILVLAKAAGPRGMVYGQSLDLKMEAQPPDQLSDGEATLLEIHHHKTGCLLSVACELGAIAAEVSDDRRAAVCQFGDKLGLAFQLVDDLLDVKGSEKLGKPKGSDAASDKLTSLKIWGLDGTKEKASALVAEAQTMAQEIFPDSTDIRELINFILNRSF